MPGAMVVRQCDVKIVVEEGQAQSPAGASEQHRRDKYDLDLDYEGTLLLLRRLHPSHSHLHFEGETCTVDLALDLDGSIEVEIWGFDGFWSMSEVTESEAESILGVAYRGEEFSGVIPGTGREWGAWATGI